jgi:D-alanyl-D-alanine carboxypeptidase/D-alanyl-D-alanine-endopeptidase (penicillin-binding protein 4)
MKGTQVGGLFRGNLYLVGGGDPTLSTESWARKNLQGMGTDVADFVPAVRALGITKVIGKLVVDEHAFNQVRGVNAWPRSYWSYECGPLSALTVNQGWRGTHLGDNPAQQPAIHAGNTLRSLLRAQGIKVTKGIRTGQVPNDASTVTVLQSPPLRRIVRFMNQTSDNFTAEVLVKQLGWTWGSGGSTAAGTKAERKALKELGVSVDPLRLVDGSGLATSNRTTARNIADLINIAASNDDFGDWFVKSLAICGHEGTLKKRLRGAYRGRVHAKTGTLNESSALSGFAIRDNGTRYGFSIVTYSPSGYMSLTAAHKLQDRIAKILVDG